MTSTQSDNINPRHYRIHPSGIECIQITEHMPFCLGNAVKYLFRRNEKGNTIEDLKKGVWYINREIERRMEESWAVWPKDERYEISSAGRVRRADSGRLRKPVQIPGGYLTFGTVHSGKNQLHYIHRAVAETFLGEIPSGMHVCHRDGDRTNNHVTNLRIDSVKGNAADKVRHGTLNWGDRNGQRRLALEDVAQIRQQSGSENSIAAKFGVSRATIGRIKRLEAWVERKHQFDLAFEKYLKHEPASDIASALELLWHAETGGNAIEDLRKAAWYIDREIKRLEAMRCK